MSATAMAGQAPVGSTASNAGKAPGGETMGDRQPGPQVRFGVTEPITCGMPFESEIAQSVQLLEALNKDAPVAPTEDLTARTTALRELYRLVRQWIYEVSVKQGLGEEASKNAGAKIFTFGSYRLGIISTSSDIDALCVAPKHISRESFFSDLFEKLMKHPEVVDLTPVPDAYTPIIKMKLFKVEIDLLFARLNMPEIPEDLDSLNDDDLLRNLDEKTVRSLNGCRVADHILSLVPNPDRFRETLRFIKIWAKRRGIYSNMLGFFGGITWAILVARICQLFPHFTASALVKRFFRVYARWNWKNPVVLCPIRESNVSGLAAFKVWNPKQHNQDRAHLMPVITPAFPAMNSTHNVTETTKRVIQAEIVRAAGILDQVEAGSADYPDVYRALPFFSMYKKYLVVEVRARSEKVFLRWLGWIESKLRHLVRHLERIPSVQARPFPNHLKFTDPSWPHATACFVGLKVAKRSEEEKYYGNTINIVQPVAQFVEIINSWPDLAQHQGECDVCIRDVARHDLPDYVPEDGAKPRKKSGSTPPQAPKQVKNDNSHLSPQESPSKRARIMTSPPSASTEHGSGTKRVFDTGLESPGKRARMGEAPRQIDSPPLLNLDSNSPGNGPQAPPPVPNAAPPAGAAGAAVAGAEAATASTTAAAAAAATPSASSAPAAPANTPEASVASGAIPGTSTSTEAQPKLGKPPARKKGKIVVRLGG